MKKVGRQARGDSKRGVREEGGEGRRGRGKKRE